MQIMSCFYICIWISFENEILYCDVSRILNFLAIRLKVNWTQTCHSLKAKKKWCNLVFLADAILTVFCGIVKTEICHIDEWQMGEKQRTEVFFLSKLVFLCFFFHHLFCSSHNLLANENWFCNNNTKNCQICKKV